MHSVRKNSTEKTYTIWGMTYPAHTSIWTQRRLYLISLKNQTEISVFLYILLWLKIILLFFAQKNPCHKCDRDYIYDFF